MALLDWLVVGLFALALIGIIVWVMRQKQNNADDYFLGGKDATWIAIGASIFASNIGSEHLIGLAGSGASSGMAMAHWEIQGLDDPAPRLGVRTVLLPLHGYYHAGIP